jgi:phosphoglycerate dehydrogenase-like enzyme
MNLSVHYLRELGEAAESELRARLHPDIQLTAGVDLPTPAEYHVLVAGRPRPEHLSASPNLKVLVIPWAGIPEATRQSMLEVPHVAVHNLHHNALPVAEQAIALLLAAAKSIIPMDRALRGHDWTPRYRPNPSLLLAGKTALVLGYGAIGHHVARLCRGLGMEVLAIRRQASRPEPNAPGDIRVAGPEALHRLLPQANAVIVCLPQTAATTGLIGAKELALLPPDALLVNIGRGPIVDEAALYRALREGTLRAAGLDVWYNYPADEQARCHTPPSTYPFHELDNVVMSPHRAGGSTETEKLRMTHLARLLNAAARGEPVPNRVGLKAGY